MQDGAGNSIGAFREGDGTRIQALYEGDGTVLWTADEDETVDDALELYLPFDEDSGTTAYDASGNGRNGTIMGPSIGHPGIAGTCYRFDGDDDEVHVTADWNATIGSGDFTLSLWVNLDTSTDTFNEIFSANPTDGNDEVFDIKATDNDTLRVRIRASGATFTTIYSSPLTINQWHHITVRVENDTITVHVDGVEDSSGTSPQIANYEWIQDTIGFGNSHDNNYYDGYMDEIRLYSRPLLNEEIQNLAETESTLTVASGETYTIPSGETETHDTANIDGTLEADGTLETE